MDIEIKIKLKDSDYGFSDLLDGRLLNIETKKEVLELIKEDIGFVFDQQITVKQLTTPVVRYCVCKRPEPRMKNSENGVSTYCIKCAKGFDANIVP